MVYSLYKIGNAIIYYAPIPESEELLIESLREAQVSIPSSITSIKSGSRRKEKLATLLLHSIVNPEIEIGRNKHGAPYACNSNIQISISHSNSMIAIGYCNDKIGIDIETISTRVQKVSHKFCSEKELVYANSIEILTKIWSSKEAIYKLHEHGLEDFKEQIYCHIESSKLPDSFEATVTMGTTSEKVNVRAILAGDNILTIALKNDC